MGSTSRTTKDMSKAQFVEYGVETDNINTAPGVELSESQKLLTGSVLDVSRLYRTPAKAAAFSIVSDVNQAGGHIALRRSTLGQETLPLD